ncbi:helix-turn-helix domain-containing protein [Marinagarivorans algicola]|uniref:helix-turn-helix domain-containing protein n=1 Tax=Marinagarivorans algicola TaxID=1513270 RepID=UPI0006B8B8B3|nr:helix-turn-helix domain-containing protein [Marinagarivorans algicola]
MPATNLRQATEQFQRQLITQALDHSQGNWAAAARQLGTDRANVMRMAKRLGIQVVKTVV